MTADYAIKLLQADPDGRADLCSRARVAESTDKKAVIDAELSAGGKVCATCRGTFVAVTAGHPAYHRW